MSALHCATMNSLISVAVILQLVITGIKTDGQVSYFHITIEFKLSHSVSTEQKFMVVNRMWTQYLWSVVILISLDIIFSN